MENMRKPHELDKPYTVSDYVVRGRVEVTFFLEATKKGRTRVTSKYSLHQNEGDLVGAPLFLDLSSEVELTYIKINGRKLQKDEYSRAKDTITVHRVPSGEFEVQTSTLIDPKANTTGEGLYQAGETMITQHEPQGFRKLFPYLDHPDVMAPFYTTIIGDKEKYPVMLANGNEAGYREFTDGKHQASFDLPFPIPSYLFALVVGKLSVLKDTYITMSGRTVNLAIYAEAKDIESGKCQHAMNSLKHSMEYDEKYFGFECDLDDYKIVATPYFNMGAMENKGLNIFNIKYVTASPETATDEDYEHVEGVIGHEYFHNWTGNKITCVSWEELGVKESITVRRDSIFSGQYRGWGLRKEISNVSVMRARQFAEDKSPRRHAIRPASIKEPNNMYTLTVYEKGAEVYKTLEGIIGFDGFLKGMKHYAQKHTGQATRIEDLIVAMEEANDVDLYQFRNWFTQSGTPTVSVEANYYEWLETLFLTVRQACSMAPGRTEMEPFDIPFAIGLIGPDGEMFSTILRITEPVQTFTFSNIPHKPALSLNRNFAPVNVEYDYAEGEMALLMARDTSLFARWDVAQTYGAKVLLALIEDVKEGRELVLDQEYKEAFGAFLREEGIDKNLLAEMMKLPSQLTLANMSAEVNPQAIYEACKFVAGELVNAYFYDFVRLYETNKSHVDVVPDFDPASVARRSVANTALGYIAKKDKNAERVFEQFHNKGMSDKYTALSLLVNRRDELAYGLYAEEALASFLEQFSDDNNVVDKWFTVQAMSSLPGTVKYVKELMNHPLFDSNNPNRIRALLGTLSMSNPVQFHTEEGYRLYADFLAEYTPKNDIVASRMVEPLTDWKRFTPELQLLMKMELLRLKEALDQAPPELVRGTMEKVQQSLAQQ